MTLQPFLSWLENTGVGTAIRESSVLFPWIESVHVLAIAAVVGTIAVVDLRLLNLTFRDRPVSELMSQVLPFTRWAFVVAAITGIAMFSAQAVAYMDKSPFVVKLFLLLIAGANIGMFHFVTARDIHTWDVGPTLPARVRFAGASSLTLWVFIVACGRWIGFV